MTTPADEAAAILVRVLESLARASGKTLKASTRADIQRACELLSSAGFDELEDISPARVSPAEAMVEAAVADPNYQRWKQRRGREG